MKNSNSNKGKFILEFGKDSLNRKEIKMTKKNNSYKRKIFSISMVKNEADIIESFVRYHCNIFDGMIIKDNCSSDNTLKILEQLKLEGKPIYILHDSSTEYIQSIKMTELLYYTIKEHNPDIIVPLDADEFLISSDKRGNPVEILNKIDLNKEHLAFWRTYIPDLSDDKNQKFIPKKIKYARQDKDVQGKVIIPQKFACKHSVKLSQGNHCVFIKDKVSNPKINNELRIAHFPVRSINQIKSKVLVGWINDLSRHDKTEAWHAWHWGILYKKMKNNQEISQNDLIKIAKSYCSKAKINNDKTIFMPIDLSFCKSTEMKYTGDEEINPLKNLLENCELLAKEYASLKNKYFEVVNCKKN